MLYFLDLETSSTNIKRYCNRFGRIESHDETTIRNIGWRFSVSTHTTTKVGYSFLKYILFIIRIVIFKVMIIIVLVVVMVIIIIISDILSMYFITKVVEVGTY